MDGSRAQTISIEYRYAEGNAERLREYGHELAQLPVDLIFAATSDQTEAARQATATIPIVFAGNSVPLETGHVASLARRDRHWDSSGARYGGQRGRDPQGGRPGGDSHDGPVGSGSAFTSARAHSDERAGRVLGVQLSDVVVRSTAEIEGAFSAVDQAGAEAVVVLLGNTFFSRQQLLADLALQHRLPTMFGAREHVAAGGLMSYAANQVDLFRRAATYVDKILRGAKSRRAAGGAADGLQSRRQPEDGAGAGHHHPTVGVGPGNRDHPVSHKQRGCPGMLA